MLNNSSKIMFLNILILGTMISISANSWLSAWMGLEINLLAFIPLMKESKLMSTESSLMYFLIQALASSLLMFAIILYLINNLKLNMIIYTKMMMLSSLFLKMASAPFHFWFPKVMEGLSWVNSLILMTWQKIAPMMLASYLILKPLFITSIILSSIFGALGGLNQTSLRKLMAYSSINHLSWMLASMMNSETLWMMYFLFYSLLSFSIIFMFNLFKISHINQLYTLYFNSKIMKFFLMMNLLSLGGLPPFIGFFPKWIVIQSFTNNNQLFLLAIMVMMTLITLFFYLRLCYSTFMLNYYENNWIVYSHYNMKFMYIYMINSFISLFMFFMITSLYLYL